MEIHKKYEDSHQYHGAIIHIMAESGVKSFDLYTEHWAPEIWRLSLIL